MAEGTTPRGGVSALLRTTTASTNASDGGVGDSLECLVSAVDELKRSMGMGEGVDLTAIEQFIARRLGQKVIGFGQQALHIVLLAGDVEQDDRRARGGRSEGPAIRANTFRLSHCFGAVSRIRSCRIAFRDRAWVRLRWD